VNQPDSQLWNWVFLGQFRSDDQTPIPLIAPLTSPYLLYEASFNHRASRGGQFIHQETIDGFDSVAIARYPVYPGRNLLVIDQGLGNAYGLAFSPNFESGTTLLSFFKIWTPKMPLFKTNPVSVSTTSSTATPSAVVAKTTVQTLLAPNPARKGATIRNDSTAFLYVDLDSSATPAVSDTDYTVKLDPGDYYEVPFGYTGAIVGVWTAANGNAYVREFT
jgi:hypothetical protein